MSDRQDVRIPAGSPDFETSVDALPLPPRDFRVTQVNGATTFRIQDRESTVARGAPQSYRVYWVPTGLSPTNAITEDDRGGISKMGILVGSVPASQHGDALTFTSPDQNGKTGKYLCVGVNLTTGQESAPKHIANSPWGVGK